MLHIKKGTEPQFLIDFKKKYPKKDYDSKEFAEYRPILKAGLIKEQKGLCAYCCGRITEEKSHNEHIEPRHPGKYASDKSLEYTNIVASCNNPETCGNNKGNSYDAKQFISPLDEKCEEKFTYYPNGTIRSIMDGTVFRAPITIPSIHPCVKNWEKPITIARHAYGDVYKSVELRADEPGVAKLVFEGKSGKKQEVEIHTFEGTGVIQGMHNTDKSIRSFAHSCFKFAIDTKQDLWFATKDTISKTYDAQFRKIFEEVYESDYKEKFAELGIEYFYTLIDDAVARVIRSKGGFIWACKNYDGDVMSDMLSTAFGSLAMMTSVLVSPDGKYEYEAAHGTVTRHYYRYLKGEDTSTNPMATIFAWSGALRKRGELDGNEALQKFGDELEAACFDTLNDGIATKDLVNLMEGVEAKAVNSAGFIAAIRERLEKRLA